MSSDHRFYCSQIGRSRVQIIYKFLDPMNIFKKNKKNSQMSGQVGGKVNKNIDISYYLESLSFEEDKSNHNE